MWLTVDVEGGGDRCGARRQGDAGASESLKGSWYKIKQNGSTNPMNLLSSPTRSLQICSVRVIKNRQGLLILCVLVPFSNAQQSTRGACEEPASVVFTAAITAAAGTGPPASSMSAATRRFVGVCVASCYSLNASVVPAAKKH